MNFYIIICLLILVLINCPNFVFDPNSKIPEPSYIIKIRIPKSMVGAINTSQIQLTIEEDAIPGNHGEEWHHLIIPYSISMILVATMIFMMWRGTQNRPEAIPDLEMGQEEQVENEDVGPPPRIAVRPLPPPPPQPMPRGIGRLRDGLTLDPRPSTSQSRMGQEDPFQIRIFTEQEVRQMARENTVRLHQDHHRVHGEGGRRPGRLTRMVNRILDVIFPLPPAH